MGVRVRVGILVVDGNDKLGEGGAVVDGGYREMRKKMMMGFGLGMGIVWVRLRVALDGATWHFQ